MKRILVLAIAVQLFTSGVAFGQVVAGGVVSGPILCDFAESRGEIQALCRPAKGPIGAWQAGEVLRWTWRSDIQEYARLVGRTDVPCWYATQNGISRCQA